MRTWGSAVAPGKASDTYYELPAGLAIGTIAGASVGVIGGPVGVIVGGLIGGFLGGTVSVEAMRQHRKQP